MNRHSDVDLLIIKKVQVLERWQNILNLDGAGAAVDAVVFTQTMWSETRQPWVISAALHEGRVVYEGT